MKFKIYVHKIVLDHQPNFLKDPCKDAPARGINARTRDEKHVRAFTPCARTSLYESLWKLVRGKIAFREEGIFFLLKGRYKNDLGLS